MSTTQNLAYAVVQVVHNFGAVATVSGSFAALVWRDTATRRKLAWLALGGWATQGASGATFGAISYYFYHQFPDISGIAVTALLIKMTCVATGFLLLAAYQLKSERWTAARMNAVWSTSAILSATALSSAAFLRWFS